MEIKYNLKTNSRRKEPFYVDKPLPFGKLETDHMFTMKYNSGEWHSPMISPVENFSIHPNAITLHYAQEIFEGAKAFEHPNGELYTFRIDQNIKRLNKSAEIMCMPNVQEKIQLEAITSLLDVERLWFPKQEGASLYIRPFMFGTSPSLGVKESESYTYAVVLSPSGPYYPEGFNPIKLLLTSRFKRVPTGGVGKAKTGGNYAASLRAGRAAKEVGAKQVLYLDPTNQFIEEAGAMNHYHVTDKKEIIIPKFTENILESITSKSILSLEDRLGLEVRQEEIPIKKFLIDLKYKKIIEAGGLGTAAVVSPVGAYISDQREVIKVGDGKVGSVTGWMYELLTEIQTGKVEAPEGWLKHIERKESKIFQSSKNTSNNHF